MADTILRGLPDALHAKLKDNARVNGLSLNAEIIRVLEMVLTDDPLAKAIQKVGTLKMEVNKYQRIVQNVEAALKDG